MFFCPDCHVSNRSDAKFCRKCGKSRSELERAEASVVVAQTPSSAEFATDSESKAIKSAPVVTESAPVVTESESEAIKSAPEATESAAEAIESVEPSENHDSEAAPNLSVKFEEEVSLSAPPDLSSPECPSCWKALRATDKFCCWCGEPQPNRVLPFLKLCLECSTFLPEKANYCYSCGTDVGYSSRRKVKVPHELFKDEESEFFPRFDA